MKTTLLKIAAFGSPLLALAAVPLRAEFDPAVVPADAQWVFYLDVNGLRDSAFGAELMGMIPEVDLDSKDLPVKVNVPKLIESIGSATAYGSKFTDNRKDMDGALVVRGTEDLRKIVQGLLLASVGADGPQGELKVRELNDVGHEAFLVHDEVIVALPPGNAILVSKSKESLAAAHALLASDKGSLARARNAVLAPLLPKGMQPWILAASVVPRDSELMPESGPQARILQMASAASVAIGHKGDMTTARIQIDATSSEMADKLVKILQGFTAMLSFTETNDAALAAFLQSVTVEKTPSGALLNLAYPTERLVQMMKTLRDDHTRGPGKASDGHHAARRAETQGRTIAEWVADKDPSVELPAPDNILTHTVPNVALKTGDVIWLNGNRDRGEHARIDYLEITPSPGSGSPLRFEAENMRLSDYDPEEVEFASGGEVIKLDDDSGSARLVFPGATGTYTLTVAYVDENDGQSPLSISITEPKPQPGPEAPKP